MRRPEESKLRADAARTLVDAVIGVASAASEVPVAEAEAALRLAEQNSVDAQFLAVFSGRFAERARAVKAQVAEFQNAVAEAFARLDAAAVPAVLIKALPNEPVTYPNFDVVVPRSEWDKARAALAGWYTGERRHPLEHDKIFLLRMGPDLHLHARVSWYEVPVFSAAVILDRRVYVSGVPVPAPELRLAILLAHAGFQTLQLDLRDLIEYRALVSADAGVVSSAAVLARLAGWERLFKVVEPLAARASAAIDSGRVPILPVAVPLRWAAVASLEHSRFLARRSPVIAARALAFRGALSAAKARKR